MRTKAPDIKCKKYIQDSKWFCFACVCMVTGVTPQCNFPPQYSEKQNYHSSPGIPYPKLLTIDTCKKQCADTPWCYGVDFDNNPIAATSRCWFFINADDFTKREKFMSGVTHIKVENRCPTSKSMFAFICSVYVVLSFGICAIPELSILIFWIHILCKFQN